MESLRDAAREPPQCASDAEILTHISDWEAAVRLYAKEYPQESITDYEREKILKNMMTPEMQKDIVRLASSKTWTPEPRCFSSGVAESTRLGSGCVDLPRVPGERDLRPPCRLLPGGEPRRR